MPDLARVAGVRSHPILAPMPASMIRNPRMIGTMTSQKETQHQVLALFELCRTKVLTMGDTSWLKNLNTPEDFSEYLRSLGRNYSDTETAVNQVKKPSSRCLGRQGAQKRKR